MISAFSIDPNVATHLSNHTDLMERLIVLVNEFTCNYVNQRSYPVLKINLSRYQKKLLPLVNQLLDKRVPQTIRKYVKAEVVIDKDENQILLNIKWDEGKGNLVVVPPYIQ